MQIDLEIIGKIGGATGLIGGGVLIARHFFASGTERLADRRRDKDDLKNRVVKLEQIYEQEREARAKAEILLVRAETLVSRMKWAFNDLRRTMFQVVETINAGEPVPSSVLRALQSTPKAQDLLADIAFNHDEGAVSVAPSEAPPNAPRVLIVEDTPDSATLFQIILKMDGYDIEVARDGLQGITAYERARGQNNPFDVLLLDLQMPGADGMQVAHIVREGGDNESQIIFLSAGDEVRRDGFGQEVRAFSLVSKPVLEDVLRHEVAEALKAKRAAQR